MNAPDYLEAARCPPSLAPQSFGLWTIERRPAPADGESRKRWRALYGWDADQTALCRLTEATMHRDHGEIVMEDSLPELRRHLPIWLKARGRVLITGLGLGCVVRGLLASPQVEHIDVIELDPDIVRIVGAEFAGEPRVTITRGDALECELPGGRWDFAWHDVWCEGNDGLHALHVKLIHRFRKLCGRQGAWMLPRVMKRRMSRMRLIG